MLILPLNSFPWVLNGTLEAKVSLDRIQRFLRLRNQDLGAYYNKGASYIQFHWTPAGISPQLSSLGSLKLEALIHLWSFSGHSMAAAALLLNVFEENFIGWFPCVYPTALYSNVL